MVPTIKLLFNTHKRDYLRYFDILTIHKKHVVTLACIRLALFHAQPKCMFIFKSHIGSDCESIISSTYLFNLKQPPQNYKPAVCPIRLELDGY